MSDSDYIGPPIAHAASTDKGPTIKAQVQQVLDELLRENLIPFALNVGKITKAFDEYTIHFYDSRMQTATVPDTKNDFFADEVRKAVLARTAKLSGPLQK
jgi:hypothetical protein